MVKDLLDNESDILLDDYYCCIFEYGWCEYGWFTKDGNREGVFKQDHKDLALLIAKEQIYGQSNKE